MTAEQNAAPQVPHGVCRADDPNPEAPLESRAALQEPDKASAPPAVSSRERGETVSVSDDRSGTGTPAGAAPSAGEGGEPKVLRIRKQTVTCRDGVRDEVISDTTTEYVAKSDYDRLRAERDALRQENQRIIESHRGLMAEADRRLQDAEQRAVKAQEEEREACAKVVEHFERGRHAFDNPWQKCAQAIRARKEKK